MLDIALPVPLHSSWHGVCYVFFAMNNTPKIKMSKEAADYIAAHNGAGGLPGAIEFCKGTIARRAEEGKESPRAAGILSELLDLQTKVWSDEFNYEQLMFEARHFSPLNK